MEFYVYRHIRLDTGKPFYVGKGTGDRAFSKRNRNRYWHFIVNKHGYRVYIVKYFSDECKSLDFEKSLIKAYNSANIKLTNINEGGTGLSGRKHSKKTIEKMKGPRPHYKPWNKGIKNPYSKESVKLMTLKGENNPMYGKNHTKESKLKMSNNSKGQKVSEATRKKISKATQSKNNPMWKGYCHTPFGIFNTAAEASKKLNINKITIQYRCNTASRKFKEWYFSKERK